MSQTLDQKRAADAWKNVQDLHKTFNKEEFKAFTNASKSAGTLIMQNGLMPTLAFYAEKSYVKSESAAKGKEYKAILELIMTWIANKPYNGKEQFKKFMNVLVNCDSATYRQHTEECLALIRWIRHFASALNKTE